ncbi:serine hydrolase [Chitinophaga japonensis]|uniref:CubicO group peptidase (Beta-lactamase class C family) n=1 Tax=Chitinophaga japonensis TaxID=104662 RepID=A0A562TF46_CHIJA|nr:serine hydrolase [Chitinophaga japonensis]TWI92159.1 CubicO group peptidase (beta-lactamase class C family) [Chitinophaga japonensis]
MKTRFLLVLTCLQAGAAYSQDIISQKTQQVETGLLPAVYIEGRPHAVYKLADRMAHYKVPAVSIAFINHGRIEWAKAYGYLSEEQQVKADTLTLFQAASISKPITSALLYKLAAQGNVALDEDVNKYLRNWKLKPSPFTAKKPVTLRGLLTHTAGLSVEGFHGYAQGSPLPTTVQILNGEPPANSAPVVSIAEPGTGYRASGGGYVVVKQAVEDVTSHPFATVIKDLVLKPAGMVHSTYEQPLPPQFHQQAAAAHDVNGHMLPGRWHTMPEVAPDGLWTTPADLARFLLTLTQSLEDGYDALLTQEQTREMLYARENMGMWQHRDPSHGWYGSGHNDGYNAEMLMFPDKGQGIVVMTNGDYGRRLSNEIIRGAARVYHWERPRPATQTVIKLDAQTLQDYAGTYGMEGLPYHVKIAVEGDHLRATLTLDNTESVLYPASKERFFSPEEGREVTFLTAEDGTVTGLAAGPARLQKMPAAGK